MIYKLLNFVKVWLVGCDCVTNRCKTKIKKLTTNVNFTCLSNGVSRTMLFYLTKASTHGSTVRARAMVIVVRFSTYQILLSTILSNIISGVTAVPCSCATTLSIVATLGAIASIILM